MSGSLPSADDSMVRKTDQSFVILEWTPYSGRDGHSSNDFTNKSKITIEMNTENRRFMVL